MVFNISAIGLDNEQTEINDFFPYLAKSFTSCLANNEVKKFSSSL